MVLLCLLSALLSYNVKRIIENWIETKAIARGNIIELKIKPTKKHKINKNRGIDGFTMFA